MAIARLTRQTSEKKRPACMRDVMLSCPKIRVVSSLELVATHSFYSLLKLRTGLAIAALTV